MYKITVLLNSNYKDNGLRVGVYCDKYCYRFNRLYSIRQDKFNKYAAVETIEFLFEN